ncbi:MAG: DUF3224 domain-containing protein [Steroidobacteraceae bacterium]
MTHLAKGTFEVAIKPLEGPDSINGISLGRISIDKTISGDLVATTKGQMLSALTSVQNSAGYVAIERVSGTLHGNEGSFVLQHSGTMNRGAAQLSVTVVPDSGTGELTGIHGEFKIVIEGGKHSFEFEYWFDETGTT